NAPLTLAVATPSAAAACAEVISLLLEASSASSRLLICGWVTTIRPAIVNWASKILLRRTLSGKGFRCSAPVSSSNRLNSCGRFFFLTGGCSADLTGLAYHQRGSTAATGTAPSGS